VSSQTLATSSSQRNSDRWRAVVFIVALVVVSRLVLSLVGLLAADVFESERGTDFEIANAQIEAARQDVSSLRIVHQWYNWDAVHYENLSRQWLDVERPALPNVVTADGGRAWNEFSWPPLYPLTIALLHGVSHVEAGAVMLLLNLVLFGGFLYLVRRLVLVDGHSESDARWAMALNVAAPFAFFLSSALTEPLFVVLAAGSLLATRQRRWILAGLLAALMVWTKNTGVLMVAPLALAAVIEMRDLRSAGWPPRVRPFVAPALCALGYAAYLGFARFLTGTARAPFLTQRYGWGNTVGNPVVNLVTNLDRWQYVAVLALLVLSVALWRAGTLTPVDATYCAVMLLSATAVVQIGGAAPRYAAVAFPLASALALWARSRHAVIPIIVTSGLLQLGLFGVWVSYWLVEMF
jgi:Gpi18-like mannosyltransferase